MNPHQLERLTAALAAHRVAALVGTTPASVAHLTGFDVARVMNRSHRGLVVLD